MSDLSITAANVVAGTGAKKPQGTAGATITAGKVVYLDSTTDTYKLADCDSATAEARSPAGIALHGASSGQPLTIHESGPLTIGATLTPGTAYYLSPNAGGICPLADVLAGDDVVLIGLATSASVLEVDIQVTGVTL
jgi:hypothetical protein